MPRHSPGHSPVHSVESVELQPDSRSPRFWPPPDPSEGSLDDDGHERHAESEHPTEILWLIQICSGLAGEDAGKDLM